MSPGRAADGASAAEPGPTRRLDGVDAARAVALLGMFAVHLLPATGPDGAATWVEALARGRSSAAFALLAGVALALAHGRRTPLRGRDWRAASAGLLVRCLLIGLLGLWLGSLDSGLAVILTYYALLFALGAPLLMLGPRALAAVAVAVALVVPAVSHVLRGDLAPKRGASPTIADLAEPGVLLTELALTGYYPVLAWVAYLAAGLAVGRLRLEDRRVAVGLAVGGTALAVASLAVSAALVGTSAATRALPPDATEAVQYGTTPPTTAWWLATAEPHSSTPLDLATTIGSALALLGVMLLLARVLGRVLTPVAWLGSMTLSLYTLHVVAVAAGLGPQDPEQLWAVHVLVALILATAWRSAWPRGPLEAMVAAPSRAMAQRVGGS